MSKSSKKSATKPLKKGKREHEDDLETKVNLKKQKKDVIPPYQKGKAEKKPKTPSTPAGESCTLLAENLSPEVGREAIDKFFKNSGKVVDVIFVTTDDGAFLGFGYVDFATSEQAKECLKFNGETFLRQQIRLSCAQQSGGYSGGGFGKGGRSGRDGGRRRKRIKPTRTKDVSNNEK
ncbi:Nucleolin 1 [Cardamine amara subsp. amara]|uniref:Nucleolin 1 n=1 Tax=Cardamine amara subsp. amara TaxID=228776 RepID=A0ABD1ACS7_CARAN